MLNDIYGKLCSKGYLAKQAELAKSNVSAKSVPVTPSKSLQAPNTSNAIPLASNIITPLTSGNYNVMAYNSSMAGAGKTRYAVKERADCLIVCLFQFCDVICVFPLVFLLFYFLYW
jgi:hypothetical protein